MAKKYDYTITENGKDPKHVSTMEMFEFKFANMHRQDEFKIEEYGEDSNAKKRDSHREFLQSLTDLQRAEMSAGRVVGCYSHSEERWYLKNVNENEIHISVAPVADEGAAKRRYLKQAIQACSTEIWNHVSSGAFFESKEDVEEMLAKITFMAK